MKKMTLCSNCHRFFDYDLYFGLCPECGTFHRSKVQTVNDEQIEIHPVEEHDHYGRPCKTSVSKQVTYAQKTPSESHKTTYTAPQTTAETYDAQTSLFGGSHYTKAESDAFGKYADVLDSPLAKRKKKFSLFGSSEDDGLKKVQRIVGAIFVALIFLSVIGSIAVPKIIECIKSGGELYSDIPVETHNPYDEIKAGDYTYVVYDAYALADSSHTTDFEDKGKIPEGKKLIAIDMNILYSGDVDIDFSQKVMPVVFDGNAFRDTAGYEKYKYWEDAFQINDTLLINDVYDDDEDKKTYGYLFYIVDEDTQYVTVSMDERTGGRLKRIHDVTLPMEDLRVK